MNKKLRTTVLRNNSAAMVLRAVEKKLGEQIVFEATSGISEWDPNSNTIRISKRVRSRFLDYLNGGTWSGRLLFHELGHAFLDTFKKRIDRRAFRAIFNGSPTRYSAGIRDLGRGILRGNVAVTNYGKSHPEEAFAEAFSYVICNVEDSDLSSEAIRQLAYVDWMIDCVQSKRRVWGRYRDYTCEVRCPDCKRDFDLQPCRIDLDIDGWEMDCPYCRAALYHRE